MYVSRICPFVSVSGHRNWQNGSVSLDRNWHNSLRNVIVDVLFLKWLNKGLIYDVINYNWGHEIWTWYLVDSVKRIVNYLTFCCLYFSMSSLMILTHVGAFRHYSVSSTVCIVVSRSDFTKLKMCLRAKNISELYI